MIRFRYLALVAIVALLLLLSTPALAVKTLSASDGYVRLYASDLPTLTKCINIDPAATTTEWILFKVKGTITVTHVDCIVDAATSTVLTLKECNSDGGSCTATEAAMTCAVTNTAESGAIDDASVAAGAWLRVTRGTVSGSPTQAVLCVTYTET